MDTLAWMGVGALAIVAIVWLLTLAYDLLHAPMGRALLLTLSIIAVVLWGCLGGLYLIVKAA